jgi:hypothetical protein
VRERAAGDEFGAAEMDIMVGVVMKKRNDKGTKVLHAVRAWGPRCLVVQLFRRRFLAPGIIFSISAAQYNAKLVFDSYGLIIWP